MEHCSITVAAASSSSRCERLRQPAVLRRCDCRLCAPLCLLHDPQSWLHHPPAALGAFCVRTWSSSPLVLSAVVAPAPSSRRASSWRCRSLNSPLLRLFAAAIAASFVCARLHLRLSPTPVPLLAALHEHAAPPGSAYTAPSAAQQRAPLVITAAAPPVDHRR